jgi:hypothetical protein
MQMATVGNFRFDSNQHGSMTANKVELKASGDDFIVVAIYDRLAKAYDRFDLSFPNKGQGTVTFNVAELPPVKYQARSDGRTFRYTAVSGKLTVTYVDSEAVDAVFEMKMKSDPDSDQNWDINITNGKFDLKN